MSSPWSTPSSTPWSTPPLAEGPDAADASRPPLAEGPGGPEGPGPDALHPPLAGGPGGPDALRPLLDTVLDALRDGAAARGGPLPAGGPEKIAAQVRDALGAALPHTGTGAPEALRTLVTALAHGAADPAHPHCAAHLHTPPLALAAAADLAASALNPSLDSWDQAPAASALEQLVTRALAAETHPTGRHPDALVTTGGTESNHLALLLAREHHGPTLQTICGANAHHSIRRAAWLLGLPEPVTVPAPGGRLDLTALAAVLTDLRGPLLVTATAGTTDTGRIDPVPEIADLCDAHGATLHIDAAYGGPLLFSETRRHLLTGLDRARTVTLDLHKLGWQPVAAGLLAVPDTALLDPLGHTAPYLNADDDTHAGLPDLLGRSPRTSRRPDILKIAVTLRALGRTGLGHLVDHVCTAAQHLADLVDKNPRLDLYERPTLTTVLFRPTGATDHAVATARRDLLTQGHAVLGRAHADGRLWFKATLLNPHTTPHHLEELTALVEGSTTR
ncbi:aminotransferase class V-fold PLP-dependent enzyme [Streptomyces sp. CB03238]|uniref:pyridoxal phosphate-dependent decarboxylase family protein n=1 Tax=Streptomyces sp. CB03238 TaxID=1907777 RepID=UPI000A0F9BC5|nr:aminotransferase class V-fold PLP-dependent enzyme [Streptomyces sp. CB03238]ORT54466.1 aspartate aminotransferase family protein [Streptomyces sp. CB03238]